MSDRNRALVFALLAIACLPTWAILWSGATDRPSKGRSLPHLVSLCFLAAGVVAAMVATWEAVA